MVTAEETANEDELWDNMRVGRVGKTETRVV